MSVQYVKLGDVCAKDSSNIAQKDLKDCFGKYPVYGAGGYIQNVDFYHQEDEYIAIVKDGAGVGRAMILPAKSSVIGTMQYIIPDKNKVDMHYLYYAIINMELGKYFSGATIPHIYFKDYQKEIFKLPDLETQKKIADNLKNIDLIIAKKNKQISLFNELVKSRFIEMFGDVVINSKNWEQTTLKNVAIGKLTYGSGASAINFNGKIRYIRITDISNDGELNDDMKSPSICDNKYLLNDGDILFARSGATVGKTFCFNKKRYGEAIYAGYLIRMIPDKKRVLPIYVFYYTKTDYYISFISKAQKAVAQPNINAQEYGDLKICVPPIELQNQFAAFVKQTDKSKFGIQKSLNYLL